MAPFNPQAQYGNDPNYLNYPRVLEGPAVNQSKAIGIETLGKGIEGSAKFLDTSIKQGIENNAYEMVDPERDKFTSALEGVKRGLDQGTIAAPVRTANGFSSGSVFDANASADDADLPPGLQSGLDRVDQLAQAYGAGSPKINDTSYSAATLSIAKQLRSQYPGYRDEVDSAVSKASGLPVANSYYQNLMTDINRQFLQMNRQQKDPVGGMMQKAITDGMPNANVYWQNHVNGSTTKDSEFLSQYNSWNNIQTQSKIDKAQRDENDANKKVQVDNETANVTKRSNNYVAHFITDNLALSGMGSLRDLTNYFGQVSATGKYEGVPQGSEEIIARQQQLANYRNMIYQYIKKDTADSEPLLGSDAVEKIRQTAMSPIDGYMTLAGGKDANPPLALYHNRQIQAIQDDSMHTALINNDTGQASRQLLTARKIYGDQYFPMWIQKSPPEIQEKMDGLFQQEKLFAVQDGTDPLGKPLPPRHIVDAIQHAKGVKDFDPNVVGGYLGLVGSITDPNMPQPMKDKLIEWGFGSNKSIMNEIKQDYRDKDGNLVPGKFAALNRMASPAISAAVAESAKHMPDNYTKYRGTVENSFGEAFRADLKDLNQLAVGHDIHFGWNDQDGHFMALDKNNRPLIARHLPFMADTKQGYIDTMLDKINRINTMGIDNLVKVYINDPNKQGTDIGSYLLKTLQTAGFRPGENITNASEGMARAIIKTKKPEATMDDMDKILGLK